MGLSWGLFYMKKFFSFLLLFSLIFQANFLVATGGSRQGSTLLGRSQASTTSNTISSNPRAIPAMEEKLLSGKLQKSVRIFVLYIRFFHKIPNDEFYQNYRKALYGDSDGIQPFVELVDSIFDQHGKFSLDYKQLSELKEMKKKLDKFFNEVEGKISQKKGKERCAAIEQYCLNPQGSDRCETCIKNRDTYDKCEQCTDHKIKLAELLKNHGSKEEKKQKKDVQEAKKIRKKLCENCEKHAKHLFKIKCKQCIKNIKKQNKPKSNTIDSLEDGLLANKVCKIVGCNNPTPIQRMFAKIYFYSFYCRDLYPNNELKQLVDFLVHCDGKHGGSDNVIFNLLVVSVPSFKLCFLLATPMKKFLDGKQEFDLKDLLDISFLPDFNESAQQRLYARIRLEVEKKQLSVDEKKEIAALIIKQLDDKNKLYGDNKGYRLCSHIYRDLILCALHCDLESLCHNGDVNIVLVMDDHLKGITFANKSGDFQGGHFYKTETCDVPNNTRYKYSVKVNGLGRDGLVGVTWKIDDKIRHCSVDHKSKTSTLFPKCFDADNFIKKLSDIWNKLALCFEDIDTDVMDIKDGEFSAKVIAGVDSSKNLRSINFEISDKHVAYCGDKAECPYLSKKVNYTICFIFDDINGSVLHTIKTVFPFST